MPRIGPPGGTYFKASMTSVSWATPPGTPRGTPKTPVGGPGGP